MNDAIAHRSIVALSALFFVAGCNERSSSVHINAPAPVAHTARDHLITAMDYLHQMDEFEPEQAGAQAAYHLNRWIEEQPLHDQWTADPMISQLPRPLPALRPLKELGQLQFGPDDVQFLQEAIWLRNISQWAAQQTHDSHVAAWLEQEQASLGPSPAHQLAVAARLFDWTIRNVQLDELLPEPEPPNGDAEAGASGAAFAGPRRAIPGPGYTLEPWQVLLYGRGDAWQRARVFILLARQQGVQAVMLAFDDSAAPGRPRPWLPAVLLDDQLYLFDAQLGLPIPGPDGKEIATLQQVRSDPGLLRALDLDGQDRYRVSESDLDRVVALCDASAEYLSRRMQLLEMRLTGEQRIVLGASPSKLAEQLRQHEGIVGVGLWTAPFEAYVYRTALDHILQQDPAARFALFREQGVFWGLNRLVRGRHEHFRGQFDSREDKLGAKALYLNARTPDDTIARLETSEQAQKQLGLYGSLPKEPAARANALKVARLFAAQEKLHASYWLGLVHFETGDYDVAADWLQRRTLEAAPAGPWTNGARYNLARCYEALGEPNRAYDLYLADDSPQRHGNLLRARRLAPLLSP